MTTPLQPDHEGVREGATPRLIMDFPAGWAFVRGTRPEDHDEPCSWRMTNGALLCDCRVLWDEYDRRSALAPQQKAEGTK